MPRIANRNAAVLVCSAPQLTPLHSVNSVRGLCSLLDLSRGKRIMYGWRNRTRNEFGSSGDSTFVGSPWLLNYYCLPGEPGRLVLWGKLCGSSFEEKLRVF